MKKQKTKGCICCLGDEPLYWENSDNNSFVDYKGKVSTTAEGKTIEYEVRYCPNCGRKFE